MLKTEEKVSLNIEDKGVIDDQKMINIASDLSYNHGDDVIIYDVREKSPFLSYYIVVSYSNESRLKKGVSVAEESLYNNNMPITIGTRQATRAVVEGTKKERINPDGFSSMEKKLCCNCF